ncbi:uroporphyrinogen-III C-methyltransferase [Ruminiclostridium herbifermentans]|uniref:uroporphyrinogen-III C-methyltransferase n=1 Tax=Ruminiclostridium herbifermentans TaxID=2488810 RepID=A0A4U7JLL8_9FIRM|nr:uroporphyrinogen-III C-methyltransferase [Ruminiclostridium herbifermentans]QNU66147.1 uroporphyrinogen-III C-methyltransferase [Ruminiclostridium herbifermentans]
MKKGFVALIGAGPGDKGLLTVKAAEMLAKAEVVVYDRLVSDDILKLIPPNAQKINVGKENKHHPVKQEEINEILLQKALEGYFVIRLKGGDPFVFGRGGEELELLIENNVQYEVVPGITSAIAAPCYAGIPATHRDYCSSFHIITGHAKAGGELAIPFRALAELKGTLVFLMGISSLQYIMDGLMEAGFNKNTPAAIVENGTRQNQRKLIATVGTLEQQAKDKQIKSPAVIVVGEVCKLSNSFDWFMNKPLFGKKVLVTRPKAALGTIAQKLYEQGAETIEYPCIEVISIQNNESFYNACKHLNEYGWILFTSKNGVDIFFDYLKSKRLDARAIANVKIAAVGRQTEKALEERGIFCDFTPEIFDGEHLAKGIAKLLKKNEKVLICDGLKASDDIVNVFNENNIEFDRVHLYDTLYTSENNEMVKELIYKGELKYVTFTSASTVEGFVKSMGDIDTHSLTAICIGNQTAKAAKRYNINYVVSDEATIESMIDKLVEVSKG